MSSSVLAVDGSVTVSEAGQRQVHFVPATVEFNGRQDVAAYFTRFIEPDEAEGCLTTSFHGRPLEGRVLTMPSGFECVVVQGGKGQSLADNGGDREQKVVRVIKRSDGFTYWNYDRVPSDEDKLRQAMQWMDLAKVLHGHDKQ